MNKKANRRAFFVCLFIGLIYVSVAIRLPEKLSFARVSGERQGAPTSMGVSVSKVKAEIPESGPSALAPQVQDTVQVKETQTKSPEQQPQPPAPRVIKFDDRSMEPGLFMSVPLVAYAIKNGLIDGGGLILIQKEGYNTPSCKRPIDILREKDEQGLRVLARLIGKRHSLDFLRKEGITLQQGADSETIVLGLGFTVEREKLLALYNTYVSDDYKGLFPFTVLGVAMVKTRKGFDLAQARETQETHTAKEEQEWMMPNLLNLPMKTAIEKLTTHTSRIKVFGNGNVTEQQPRAFERTRGETECIIYGRTSKQ
jgi:hypothetical protein